MSYKFFGCDSKSVTPIDQKYSNIEDQRHLYDLLFDIWSIDTCAPRLRKDWNENNKTLGQCSITAFLVQDIFGGEVYGIPTDNGGVHCFNKIGDVVFDLTSEQFGDKKLTYNFDKLQSRDTHFQDSEKKNRYLILKEKLIQKISKN